MPSRKSNHKPKLNDLLPVPVLEWAFDAIGTSWWIGLYESLPDDVLADLKRQVAARIEEFDRTYSRFRNDSTVSAIAKTAGSYQLPPDSRELFAFYRQLYDCSDGLVTPLIGQTLSDAGYDATYSLQSGEVRHPPIWDDVMVYTGNILTTKQPVLLDFGAAGKGYLVDIISGLLSANGVTRFCVDAGGDMRCAGLESPLRIGLENPDDTTQVIGVAELGSGALCGSAGNRRAWGKYHHIMNPQTLTSPGHIKAVWVAAETAMLADGLTTVLYFVAPAKLLRKFSFSYAILDAEGGVQYSQDFPATFYE